MKNMKPKTALERYLAKEVAALKAMLAELQESLDLEPPTDEEVAAKLRAEIEGASKKELVALLEAHGVEKPKGKVDELREQALAVVFVGPMI